MTNLTMMSTMVKYKKQYAEQITITTYRSMLTVVTHNVALMIFVHLN